MVSVSFFGVRVSVMFHFMFVHYTFSSVWVAEWPLFGKKAPARLAICSHCILSICNIYSRPKLTLHFSFLNISILVLILSKWNIAISFQHFSTHNS